LLPFWESIYAHLISSRKWCNCISAEKGQFLDCATCKPHGALWGNEHTSGLIGQKKVTGILLALLVLLNSCRNPPKLIPLPKHTVAAMQFACRWWWPDGALKHIKSKGSVVSLSFSTVHFNRYFLSSWHFLQR
jgi:hypothetical protein